MSLPRFSLTAGQKACAMLIGMGLACSPKIYGAVKAFKGISKADRKLVKSALERRWERGDIYQPSIEGGGAVIIL